MEACLAFSAPDKDVGSVTLKEVHDIKSRSHAGQVEGSIAPLAADLVDIDGAVAFLFGEPLE